MGTKLTEPQVEYWPKPPQYQGHPFGPWWCGNCGGLHGWDCPYSEPGGAARMKEDEAAGTGPYRYGPYPGGQKKARAISRRAR